MLRWLLRCKIWRHICKHFQWLGKQLCFTTMECVHFPLVCTEPTDTSSTFKQSEDVSLSQTYLESITKTLNDKDDCGTGGLSHSGLINSHHSTMNHGSSLSKYSISSPYGSLRHFRYMITEWQAVCLWCEGWLFLLVSETVGCVPVPGSSDLRAACWHTFMLMEKSLWLRTESENRVQISRGRNFLFLPYRKGS